MADDPTGSARDLAENVPQDAIPFVEQQTRYVEHLETEIRRTGSALREMRLSGVGTFNAIARIESTVEVLKAAFGDYYVRPESSGITKQVGNFVRPPLIRELEMRLDEALETVGDERAAVTACASLDNSIERALLAAEHEMSTHRDVESPYREWVATRIAAARERLILNDLLDRARAAATSAGEAEVEAKRAAIHTRDVAGAEATGGLSEHFAEVAHEERIQAIRWRAGAVIVALVVAGAAAVFLGTTDGTSTADLLRKLSVGLPLAVLGGYCASQATRHRDNYDWARRVDVQLRTMRAFVQPLPDELQHAVLTVVAHTVFGRGSSEGEPESVAEARQDATLERLLERLLDRLVERS